MQRFIGSVLLNNGRVTIPEAVRNMFSLKNGEKIDVLIEEGKEIIILRRKS